MTHFADFEKHAGWIARNWPHAAPDLVAAALEADHAPDMTPRQCRDCHGKGTPQLLTDGRLSIRWAHFPYCGVVRTVEGAASPRDETAYLDNGIGGRYAAEDYA